MRNFNIYILTAAVLILTFGELIAQERVTERGTYPARRHNVHRGNQVRTVFSNFGVIAQDKAYGPAGAWRYDDNGYVGDVSPVVGVRLPIKDWNNNGIADARDTIVSVVITDVARPGGGDYAQGGQFRGFEPLLGFINATNSTMAKGVAMSHQPETWPTSWPDRPTWSYSGEPIIVNGLNVSPTVDWNGYFGRAQMNADQESYFWMDDFNDDKMYNLHGYYPDMNDTTRRGQALQVAVRGLQWSNFLAQDVVFWLYNIKNDGTETYDQTVFGTVIGTYVGISGNEWDDDVSFFDVREAITYTWDFEGRVRASDNPKWQPNPSKVGYIAYAFLESPGNPYDGVDNDADNRNLFPLSASYFTGNDYNPKTVTAGDKLILIDKATFSRTSFTMPNDTITVFSMGVPFFLQPGITSLREGTINTFGNLGNDATDGIDNDLDGLIDENYVVHYRQFKRDNTTGTVLFDTINPVQYKDYIGALGLNDKMLDEKRNDLIDNDQDWSAQYDDVGADGQPGTGDAGEGDGVPTPGEPNFDALDVDESDQLGLTSFWYFVPSNVIKMSNEEDMWKNLKPGFFEVPKSIVNNVAIKGEDGDFMYGSGYFPLLPGQTERFSLALAFGDDFRGVLKTKRIAQVIYNANYNFPRPPEKPTVTAVAGDGQVTLYWDRVAENSLDPSLKEKDFEGYKIYKGTDPDLSDALQISDGTGQKVFYRPVAQYDLKNGIYGYFLSGAGLYDLTSGAPFYLGNETGVQNSFVDSDVLNGKTYYYAVVAYDRGKAESDVFPSENTRFIAKDALGNLQTDINTVAVTPNAPVLGYVPPESGLALDRIDGFSTATPYFEVVDPFKLSKTMYVVSFLDSLKNGVRTAYAYSVKDSLSGLQILSSVDRLYPSNGDIFNGVRISFDTSYQSPDSIRLDMSRTSWRINNPISDTTKRLGFTASRYEDTQRNIYGVKPPVDLAFVFSDTYADSSNDLRTLFGRNIAKKTAINFKIFDVTDRANPVQLKFVMTETAATKRDTLSDGDAVVVATKELDRIGWRFAFLDTAAYVAKGGDTLIVSFFKPFTSADRFIFNSDIPAYDAANANEQMERVKAVPNPYVVTNVFEEPLPTQIRGRGERIINFINLPPKSRVYIYTSAGAHIRTIEHDGDLLDGSLSWDLRTKEGLDVAYGVYFYVVEAEGVSAKKYGKLAIIK